MKIGVIKKLAGEHAVRKLCRTLGVARSAYYAAQKKAERPGVRENARLGTKMRALFEASGRTYGSPRLTVALRRAGERCGRHRVARLMRKTGLRAKQKRRFRPRTTDSRHLCPVAPNHLAERAELPTRPGEVWQADITYVATREGWLYVAGVLDACSRKIVGWAADDTMPTALVARAFERALALQQPAPGLLHHSDRGSQYASDAYRELLRRHGVQASMSRAGNCYDNAKMESFWATLKTELIDGQNLRHPRRSKKRDLLVHRGLLQPGATPRRTRLSLSRGLRAPSELNIHQPGTPTGPQNRGKIIRAKRGQREKQGILVPAMFADVASVVRRLRGGHVAAAGSIGMALAGSGGEALRRYHAWKTKDPPRGGKGPEQNASPKCS